MNITVADTSTWVSAMQFRGTPFDALVKALSESRVAYSSYIKNEVLRVLSTKFEWESQRIQDDLDFYLKNAPFVKTIGAAFPECRDPKDHAIIETAINARAFFLISGDKDLLALDGFQGVPVVTTRQYWEQF